MQKTKINGDIFKGKALCPKKYFQKGAETAKDAHTFVSCSSSFLLQAGILVCERHF